MSPPHTAQDHLQGRDEPPAAALCFVRCQQLPLRLRMGSLFSEMPSCTAVLPNDCPPCKEIWTDNLTPPSDLGLGVLLTAQSSQQTRLFQLHVSTAAGDQYNTSGGSKQLLPFRLLYPSLIPRPCHKVARSPSTVMP